MENRLDVALPKTYCPSFSFAVNSLKQDIHYLQPDTYLQTICVYTPCRIILVLNEGVNACIFIKMCNCDQQEIKHIRIWHLDFTVPPLCSSPPEVVRDSEEEQTLRSIQRPQMCKLNNNHMNLCLPNMEYVTTTISCNFRVFVIFHCSEKKLGSPPLLAHWILWCQTNG